MITGASPRSRPVVFGEVLFDRFEDGSEVLGGAPFNVAWHLAGFGASPIFVSRTGTDARASRIRRRMSSWGMDDEFLQVDPQHATGEVVVRVEAGQPAFDIARDRAYDHIDADAAAEHLRPQECSIFYHGTLALRGESSRAAYERLTRAIDAPLFYDVNLRDPHTPVERARERAGSARWIKLNAKELGRLTATDLCEENETAIIDGARSLQREIGAQTLLVTRGAAGSLVVHAEGGVTVADAAPVDSLVDTVGAGDAFSAVCIWALLREWSWEMTLSRASRFASMVCSWQGATSNDIEVYRALLAAWREPNDDR